jgi:hypothetical protein
MFTTLTDIWPFQPVYLLWFYIHATKRCSSRCYNRHCFYLTTFWCNTDTGHSFSQAVLVPYLQKNLHILYLYTILNKSAGDVLNKGRHIMVCSTELFFGHTTNRLFFCFLAQQHIGSHKTYTLQTGG